MLLDEDEDYDLGDPPNMQRLSERYSDNPYPASMDSRSSFRTSNPVPMVPSIHGSTSPHLLGLRASESGSIFHEAVWPPPGEGSRLVDPLVAPSSSVDLGRIVGDVMGTGATTTSSAPSHPSTSQTSFQPSFALASGVSNSHSRQTSSTRLLSSPNFQYPTNPAPPEYDYDEEARAHELDLARAQSPDSQMYVTRSSPLRIANAGPDSPVSPSHAVDTPTPPGTPRGKTKNWLERSPKNVHTHTLSEDTQASRYSQASGSHEVIMGEAL